MVFFPIVFLFLDKVFSYLSADEIEKLHAEEEKKIANLTVDEFKVLDHSDDESNESLPTR